MITLSDRTTKKIEDIKFEKQNISSDIEKITLEKAEIKVEIKITKNELNFIVLIIIFLIIIF